MSGVEEVPGHITIQLLNTPSSIAGLLRQVADDRPVIGRYDFLTWLADTIEAGVAVGDEPSTDRVTAVEAEVAALREDLRDVAAMLVATATKLARETDHDR